MTEMLRTKLQENTQLDLSQYTKEELGFLCRIGDRNTVLSAGGTYSLVRTSQGLVYSFGAGDERTGNGRETTDNDYNIPMPIKINNIVAVSVGWNYSLILNDQGQVFSFGGNYYGQLGLGLSRGEVVTFPTKTIDDQKVGKIVAISAGHDHSLILNSQGQVFSFGSNEDGKLGLGTKEKFYPEPMRIGALENIIAISAGYNHSLFLNSQGQAYSCGGNDYGQLGLEDGVDVPTLIDDPDLGEIIAISAGFYCSLLLNSQGQVFNCSEDGIVPVDISDIVSISAGEGNFLLLNSRGQVFSLGNNRKGQSGLGPRQKDDIKTPTLIRTPVGKIVSISAGDSHSLILNSRGQVFSFGDDEYGKLGLGDHPLGTSILVPTLIEGLVL
jgi:alpha-tubulin suppressor-like RCC1 family protein